MGSKGTATSDWGRPLCSNCGHDLTGLVDSSKCSECGRPLVEVLVREAPSLRRFRRYTSKARLCGLPALSIARGIGPDGRPGHARGWIAIGDKATGVVALGGSAFGILTFGGLSVGIFSFGGMSVGALLSFGGMSLSPLGLAVGGMAVGALACGGMAAGIGAVGGSTFGYCTWGPGAGFGAVHRVLMRGGAGDPVAIAFFERFAWLFGSPSGRFNMLQPMAWALSLLVGIGGILVAPAILRWARDTSDEKEQA